MQSMLKQKPTDDPHDIPVVAPDAVRVAPLDDAPPAHDAATCPAAEPLIPAGSDFSPGAAVPPVDTTFRPTAVDDVLLSGGRRSIGQRALRAVTAFLLTACISGAAIAWHSYGGAAQQMIAEWAPLFAQKSSQPSEKTGLPAQPALAAAEVDAANATSASGPVAAEAAAPVAPAYRRAIARDDGARSCQCGAGDRSAQGQHRATQGEPAATRCHGVREECRAGLRPKKPAQPGLSQHWRPYTSRLRSRRPGRRSRLRHRKPRPSRHRPIPSRPRCRDRRCRCARRGLRQ